MKSLLARSYNKFNYIAYIGLRAPDVKKKYIFWICVKFARYMANEVCAKKKNVKYGQRYSVF